MKKKTSRSSSISNRASTSTIESYHTALDVTDMVHNERDKLLPTDRVIYSHLRGRPLSPRDYRTMTSDEDEAYSSNAEDILYCGTSTTTPLQPPAPFHPSTNYYLYIVTISSAVGGFLFGYDTGIVSGAMVFIRDEFKLNDLWQELVVSSTILSAWMFSLLAGWLTDLLGRKKVILLASIIFTAGGFLMAFAWTKYILLAGRFTVGAAVGLASMAIPVYIAEVAPLNIRGRLVTLNTVCITFGQFVASIVAGIFSYDETNGFRWMLGLGAVPSMIQFFVFLFMPESPRWLVKQGDFEGASSALHRFRQRNTKPDHIRRELETIMESCRADDFKRAQFCENQRAEAGEVGEPETRKPDRGYRLSQILSSVPVRRALLVGCLLQAFQQLSGINTVMYYSATIIQMSGVSNKSQAVWLSTTTASFNFIFSLVGILLVERAGRRPLTLFSLAGVVFALFLIGGGFQLAASDSPSVSFHVSPDSNHTPWARECNAYTSCAGCVSSLHCGFCFYDSGGRFEPFVRSSSGFNGTCLAMDPGNSDWAADGYKMCSMDSADAMTWANAWCPSRWSWTTLVGLMLYLVFFAPGMGPMPWTINSEIYPLWARSICYSTSTSVCWFFNLLVSLTFLTLTRLLTKQGAFYLYGGLAALGWVLLFLLLPETKGKSLEEMEVLFEGPCLVGVASKRNGYKRVNSDDTTNRG